MKIVISAISFVTITMSLANAQMLGQGLGQGIRDDGVYGFKVETQNFGYGRTELENFGNDTTSGSCDWSKNIRVPTLNVLSLTADVTSSINVFSCVGARFSIGARYTTKSCQEYISCRQNIENGGAEVKKASKVLNEIIAKDYIKNSIIINGDEMERLEVVTKFAQKKFDKKLGAQCHSRFISEGKLSCNFNLVEKAFDERQKECSPGIGCYKDEDKELKIESFSKFKEKNNSKFGTYTKAYFDYRTDKVTDVRLDEDDDRINALAKVGASAEFKKAKPEAKIQLIIDAIGRDTHGRLKDPILGYEFGNENPANARNADKFKELLKIMDSKNFKNDFDSFRRKKAEGIFSAKNVCSKTNTIIQICNEASDIASGKKIKKNSVLAEYLSSSETSKGLDLSIVKDILGPKFSEEDYDSILNAKRCVAFGITDDWGNPLFQDSFVTRSASGKPEDSDSSYGATASDGVKTDRSPSSTTETVKPNGTETSIVEVMKPGYETASDKSVSEGNTVSDEESAADFSSAIGQTPQGPVTSNFTDMYGASSFDTFSPKPIIKPEEEAPKADDAPATTGTNASQDKMNEYLMKKLAAAEENLEKLKADAASAEEERAKQKKIDEEQALIKDLKGQIADLKTQSAKNNERKIAEAAVEEQSRAATVSSNSYTPSSSAISARSEAPAAKAAAAENYAETHSAAPAPQSSSRSASSSGAILTSVSNSDGSRTTTLGSGLIVTTVDGMSSEKAQQTISNRILELNGTPFYIEEGGMVKEIIAVVKDGKVLLDENGKPIFEKIVKGKVGDKKFAAKADKKDRAPASITDVADLKRDQEEKLKRERAEYMKLKNLTNGALKKK